MYHDVALDSNEEIHALLTGCETGTTKKGGTLCAGTL